MFAHEGSGGRFQDQDRGVPVLGALPAAWSSMSQPILPPGGNEPVAPHLALVRQVQPHAVASWLRLVLLGALTLALGLGLLELFQLLARPLGLLFLGLVIATALLPLVDWLNRGLPRLLAVLLPYAAVLALIGAATYFMAPALVAQAQAALNYLPDLTAAAWSWLTSQELVRDGRLMDAIIGRIDAALSAVTNVPLAVTSALIEVIAVLFMSAYWLLAMPRLRQFTLGLAPEGRRAELAGLFGAMGQTMGGYLRGVVIDSVVIGVVSYLGLVILGVRFPVVLALVSGLLEGVPYLGPILSGAAAVAVALLDGPEKALLTLVFWIVMQQLENNLLVPYVMRSQTDIPPLLVIFAIIAGFAIGGILGALVAIPLSGALRVLALRVALPIFRRWTGAETIEVEVPPPQAA